jgi:preprotein translocase subunit SecG
MTIIKTIANITITFFIIMLMLMLMTSKTTDTEVLNDETQYFY